MLLREHIFNKNDFSQKMKLITLLEYNTKRYIIFYNNEKSINFLIYKESKSKSKKIRRLKKLLDSFLY